MLGISRKVKMQPLLDLAYGGFVSFHGIGPSETPHHVTVYVKPANHLGKPIPLPEVPESALLPISLKHVYTPQSLMVLRAGVGGEAPLWNVVYKESAHMIEEIAQLKTRTDIAQAAKAVLEKQQLRSAEEVVAESIKTTEKINKTRPVPYDVYQKKPVRSLT